MKVVYIAGPFRGPNAWQIAANIRQAEELSFEVAKIGAMPLCPHKNTENMHGALPDQFFLDGTLELMRRCDAVLLTEDWARSSGARGEVKEAIVRGIPVFWSAGSLEAALHTGDMVGFSAPVRMLEDEMRATKPTKMSGANGQL